MCDADTAFCVLAVVAVVGILVVSIVSYETGRRDGYWQATREWMNHDPP